MNEQQRIRELKENLTRAIREKDVLGATAPYAEKIVMFVLAPPLRFKTGEDSPGANGIEEWFSTFEREIGLEYQELDITVSGDVAFCHSLEHLTGKRIDGAHTDMWFRETLGLSKMDGDWKITHQHQSVPIYMDGSGKSAIDLEP